MAGGKLRGNVCCRYHPDKNPDPTAAVYFAEHITKAYKALSDEDARKNYEKHGHPDGPQARPVAPSHPISLAFDL